MINRRNAFVGLVLGVTLCGCVHEPAHVIGAPVLDSRFGEAVTRARAMQVINPEGVTVNDQGYSGKAAHQAIERYEGRPIPAPSSNPPSSSTSSASQPANGAANTAR
jgi:hypothetical protein